MFSVIRMRSASLIAALGLVTAVSAIALRQLMPKRQVVGCDGSNASQEPIVVDQAYGSTPKAKYDEARRRS